MINKTLKDYSLKYGKDLEKGFYMRKYLKAMDIYRDTEKREDIEKRYVNGATLGELKDYVGCSYNTINIVLGMIGFEVSPYFKKQADAQMKRFKAKRTLAEL